MTTDPTILSNFEAWLKFYGVDASRLEFMTGEADQFTDRLFLKDPGLLIVQVLWMENASSDANDPCHGKSCVASLRERSVPSLQCCVHRGFNATTGKKYLYYEVDFDKAPPSKPVWVMVHLGECAVNVLTHGKTDQAAIQRGLIKRGMAA